MLELFPTGSGNQFVKSWLNRSIVCLMLVFFPGHHGHEFWIKEVIK